MSQYIMRNTERRTVNMCSPRGLYAVVVFNKLDFQQIRRPVHILLVESTNKLHEQHFRIIFSQFLSICNSITRAQDLL